MESSFINIWFMDTQILVQIILNSINIYLIKLSGPFKPSLTNDHVVTIHM